MATTFYPTSTANGGRLPSTWTDGTWTQLLLSLSRGSGSTGQSDATQASLSVVGPFAAVPAWGIPGSVLITLDTNGNMPADPISTTGGLAFISNPLNAVTISGAMTANIRALETNAMANYGVGILVSKLNAAGTATVGFAHGDNQASELGTSDAARSVTLTVTSTAFAAGDRLVVVLVYIGIGTSASGYTATGTYNGTTAAAAGDTSITFNETITEQAVAANPPFSRNLGIQLLAQ